MLCVLKYSVDTVEQGLVLEPNRKWDGSQNHKFVISERSDLDYAKEPKDRRSVLGHVVYLEGVPAMFKSSTERTVSLSITKAETYAGVTCVQDMLYIVGQNRSSGLLGVPIGQSRSNRQLGVSRIVNRVRQISARGEE